MPSNYPFMVLFVVTGNSDHIPETYVNNIILCVVSEYKIKLAIDIGGKSRRKVTTGKTKT
jgi:hypothetical protein